MSFATTSGENHEKSIDLYSDVLTEGFSHYIGGVKMELTLRKARDQEWKALEKAAIHSFTPSSLSYPSSAKNKHDWDILDKEAKAEIDKEKESIDAFFQKIYANANEDTKRAMMKSFVG